MRRQMLVPFMLALALALSAGVHDTYNGPRADPGGGDASATTPIEGARELKPVAGHRYGRTVRRVAIENENADHDLSRREALRDARYFDVIVASPWAYDGYVRAMKRANADLTILAYMNGMYVDDTEGWKYPLDWYAKDKLGLKIRSRGYGNYLMNPLAKGWVQNRVATCKGLLRSTGYDGCSLDMITIAPLYPGYNTAVPVDPRTGDEWNPRAWTKAIARVPDAVRDALGRTRVWANGYSSGPRYFNSWAPSRTLNAAVDGGISESWIRTASSSLQSHRPLKQWRQSVDQLVHLQRQGRGTAAMQKLWADGSRRQKNVASRFGLGTFLLGAGRHSTFTVSYSTSEDRTQRRRLLNLRIGDPSGHYRVANGVYRRRFEGGMVLVNPHDGTRTANLPRRYVDERGRTVKRVGLAGHRAAFLRLPG